MDGRSIAWASLLSLACGPVVGENDDPSSSSEAGSVSTSAATSASTSAATSTSASTSTSTSVGTTTVADTSSSSTDADTNDDGPVCILHHHEIGIPGGCSDDSSCCPGEKCVPSPDYSECVALEPMAVDAGEPCTRNGVEDDCAAGTVCRGVDVMTGEGRCVEFCGLGHACDDAATVCTGDLDPALCLPPCDPLAMPACEGGAVCLPFDAAETFACMPDELPAQSGMPGDPCALVYRSFAGCDPGNVCVDEGELAIESCASDLDDGCCTKICALDDPLSCAGIGSETCEPFHTVLFEFWAEKQYGVGFCR